MSNNLTNDFSVLSPSEKKELERKQQEQERKRLELEEKARKATEEKARKAKAAAQKARETALRNAATRKAEAERKERERQSKKNAWTMLTVLCIVLIFIVVWLWIHLGNKWCGDDLGALIAYYIFSSIVAAIPIFGLIGAVVKCVEKIKEYK